MAIGTALAVSAGIAAAGSITSAAIGAKAAGKAAKTQQQAARDASAAQASALAPYTQAGSSAVNTLSRLLGAPEGSQFASLGNFQPGGTGGPGPGPTPAMQAGALLGGMPRGLDLSGFAPTAPPGMAGPPEMGPGPGPGMGMPPPGMAPTAIPRRAPEMAAGPRYDGRTPLRLEDFFVR